jgi:hypothetical protein
MTRARGSTSKATAIEELRRISEDPDGATAPESWRRAQTLIEVRNYVLQFDEEVAWEDWTGLRERMRAAVKLVLRRQGRAETSGSVVIAGVDGRELEAYATRFAKRLGIPAEWGVEAFSDFALIVGAAAVDGARWPDGADLYEHPTDRARWPSADLLDFADTLLAVYRAHLIPVGWLGRWPSGELVVANAELLRGS